MTLNFISVRNSELFYVFIVYFRSLVLYVFPQLSITIYVHTMIDRPVNTHIYMNITLDISYPQESILYVNNTVKTTLTLTQNNMTSQKFVSRTHYKL